MPAPDWQNRIDANFADARTFAQRLSDAAKYVWVGSFALLYAAMLAESDPLKAFYAHRKWLLLAAAILGAISFVSDLVKNVAGFNFAMRLSRWIPTNLTRNPGQMDNYDAYDQLIANACAPTVSRVCLWLSVVAAGISAILIAIAFLLSVPGAGH